ncbi:MAG: DUF5666 domain-containing protein [Candidatus Electrothrix communis]|nr:hypothetical protein [Desulfobulbus sp. US4]WLE98800.1 MAG: DUF5666 domain-containing protein [Candidatus Electrothrix communis]
MKTFSFSIELFSLAALLLATTSLTVQAAGTQAITEEKAHSLYQAGALYGERNEILFRGVVQKAPLEGPIGTWTVDGSDVLVSEATVVKGEPVVGSYVELDGSWLVRNKIFKAYDFQVQNETDPLLTGQLVSTVDQMPTSNWPYGIWIVDGRKVNVKKGVEVNEKNGKAKTGAGVAIKGSYVDGVFTASELVIKATSAN